MYNTSKMSSHSVHVKNNVLTYLQKLEKAQYDIIQKLNLLEHALGACEADFGLADAIELTIGAAQTKLIELERAIDAQKQHEEQQHEETDLISFDDW